MTSRYTSLSSLPVIAFGTLATSDEPSHYQLETTKAAEELNTKYGVSPAQARAIPAGTTLGWHAMCDIVQNRRGV